MGRYYRQFLAEVGASGESFSMDCINFWSPGMFLVSCGGIPGAEPRPQGGPGDPRRCFRAKKYSVVAPIRHDIL